MEENTVNTPFISSALRRSSEAYAYRFYLSGGLFFLMLFLLCFHYSEVGFFIVVLISAIFCADIFVRSAWEDLWHGETGFPLLVSVAVYAGFFYSALHTFLTRPIRGPVTELYLYVSAFLTLALWAQRRRVWERERAGVYIKKINDFLPKAGRKYDGRLVRKVFADELIPGDEVIVRPGERLPCDGVIRKGQTAIDEELITGNMLPAYKRVGNPVYAGTVNKSSDIYVTVTNPLSSSVLMGIMDAVQQSEKRRSTFTTDLDIYSACTFLAVVGVSIANYAGVLYRSGFASWWQESGTLLVFLSLCTPLGLLFADLFPFFFAKRSSQAHGIHIQNRYALDQLAEAEAIFLDKTGTLTYGHLTVHGVYPSAFVKEHELVEAVACAEQQANGPFAQAVAAYAKAKQIVPPPNDSLDMMPGTGIRATSQGHTILAGRLQWIEEQGVLLPAQIYQEKETLICVAKDGKYLGYLTLSDALRPGAKEVINALKQREKSLLLLSGDNEPAVNAVADALGIEKRNSNVLPKTKAEIIANMRALGKKVVMVGDGFNDIIALLRADAGIAFSSSKNVYNNWVDILISRRDLYPLVEMLEIRRRTRHISHMNAVLAFILNMGWVEFLCWHGKQMSDWRWTLGGSLAVVLLIFFNSMRLLKYNDK
ncbi:MAG: cation-translocating P-type ATPase [Elusimicrobiaceae bacterium]|nr:cation-translocating P-type ATPase [Elusimicrobiaceae bacterium]